MRKIRSTFITKPIVADDLAYENSKADQITNCDENYNAIIM
jgi:hypothetical protein